MFYYLRLSFRKNRDSLKSGTETQQPRPWDLVPWDPIHGTLDLGVVGPRELSLATLRRGTVTPGTLEMGPWDPETSN